MSFKLIKSYQISEGQAAELLVRSFQENAIPSPEVELLLKEAYKQTAEAVAKARKEEESILREARKQAEDLLRQSREEGYRSGYQDALEAAKDEAETIRLEAKNLLEAAHREKQLIVKDSTGDIRRLVYVLTERLTLKELEVDSGVVNRLVEQAITQCSESKEYQVYANPAEIEVLRQQKPVLQELLPLGSSLALIPDSAITKGGCRVITGDSVADATVEIRLDALGQFLLRGEEGQNVL